MTSKNSTLVKALIATATALSLAGAAQAHSKAAVIEKLPMVVVSGKSVQAQARAEVQRVVLLPRVVIEGRSLAAQQRDTLLAAAKPAVCNC